LFLLKQDNYFLPQYLNEFDFVHFIKFILYIFDYLKAKVMKIKLAKLYRALQMFSAL